MAIHAFSIDLEDWYHGIELPSADWHRQEDRLRIGLDAVLSLLDEADVKATFFTLGWVAERHPRLVRQLAESGHEIGSHGPQHEKLYDLTPEQFKREEQDTKVRIEDAAGFEVQGFRAPFFSVTRDSLWSLDILAELGYRYDCSISPVVTWRYGIDGAPEGMYRIEDTGLIEFTVSTWRLAGRNMSAGGAYFRIFPSWLTRSPYKEGDAANRPSMFYAHPWEYDPDHPVIDFERKARFTHYFNLRSMGKRTRRLLARHRFATVRSVIDAAEQHGELPKVSVAQLMKGGSR